MMKKPFVLLIIALLATSIFPANTSKADAAPPWNPPGGNVSPEGKTEVSMIAETVLIDFRSSTDDNAQVTAEFLFRNLGTSDEHMRVRFPLNGDPSLDSNPGESEVSYPLIADFEAYVNGEKAPTTNVKDTDPGTLFFLGYTGIIYWATFDADFPVGQDVKINVRYTINPTDYGGEIFVFYFLATGAGWKGPIGSADVILRLPYQITPENSPDPDYRTTTYKTKIVENEVQWHWDNLEPTSDDNLNITFIRPSLWMEILRARTSIISDPENGEAWARLGQAYHAAEIDSKGYSTNPQINHWWHEAYQRALILSPMDLDIHVQFTKALLYEDPFPTENQERWERILWEISYILEKDPTNEQAQQLLDEIKNEATNSQLNLVLPTPGGPAPAYSNLTLTPTSTPVQTDTPQPTQTPQASLTLQPTNSPTAAVTATNISTLSPTPTVKSQPTNTQNTNITYIPMIVVSIAVGWIMGRWVTKRKK